MNEVYPPLPQPEPVRKIRGEGISVRVAIVFWALTLVLGALGVAAYLHMI
jgi:hypothetical protein